MLQAALVLFPCDACIQVEGASAMEEVALIQGKDRKESMGYEKYVRAGSFKGRVGLQVVRPQRSRGILYTGALCCLGVEVHGAVFACWDQCGKHQCTTTQLPAQHVVQVVSPSARRLDT